MFCIGWQSHLKYMCTHICILQLSQNECNSKYLGLFSCTLHYSILSGIEERYAWTSSLTLDCIVCLFFCSNSHLLPPSEGVIYLSACHSYPKEDKYLTFFSPIKWIIVHDTPDDLSRHTNVPQHTHSVAWHFVYLFSPKHHTSRWQCVKKNIRYKP